MRPRRVFISFLAALLALIWGFSSFQISRADTYIVTNTDDDGAGSLRQAIANANASVGVLDTIQFSIDTGTQTIFLLSPLNITDPVILDGTTQPGFTGSPLIILDGVSAGAGANGIIISGGGSTISGLSVGRFEGAGIQIAGSGSVIIGNYIGTDGVNPLPNGIGIEILGSGNRVGGTVGGSGNLITNNVGPSILIDDGGVPGAAVNNAILGNAIFDNGGLGIDLFPPGVTPNDAGDTDGGPNNLQNFPVITAATPGSVTGTLASAPDTTYRIEFYRNTACDSSTYGEGENYLDFLDVTTDGAGDASFSISTLPLTAGDFLTVTATAPNNDTSEFSECVEVVDAPIYLSDPLPDPDPGSLLTIFTTEGVPASAIIQVRNPGTAELNVTQVSLDNLTDFSLLSAASFNVPAGGGPVTIEIQCDADTGPGLFTTGVTVEHNAAGSPASYTVDCDVASVPTPVYISAPAPGEVIDLGTTAFGSSVTGSLHITNLGTANLTVSEPAAGFFSGANAADFSLVAGTAPPFTLGPSDDWTVIIRCTPLAAGDRTAILTFDTTDPVRPSVSYTLNCRALLLLSPTTLPDGAVGVLYPDQTITANGGSGSYAFDLFSGSLPPGLTLSPGGLLSGTPTLAGTFPFTVRATDNADNSIIGTQNYTIIITDAVPGYDSSPAPSSTITVGTATVGTPVSTTLTVSETGSAPLDVGLFGGSLATAITGANAADFTITAPAFPFTIADGGANQPITIQCTPAAEGLRTATLTLTSNDPAWPTIAYPLECTGTVVLTPIYQSVPAPGSTINLTTTQDSPVSANIAVSNPGSAPLNVTSVVLSNSGNFSLLSAASFSVPAGGGPTDIIVQCNADEAHGTPYTTTVTVTHDAAGNLATYTVNCTVNAPADPGYDSSPAPNATISVGTATVGTPVSTTLTVSETGGAALTVGLFGGSLATAITGANAADFTITNPAFPFTIADGGANQPITIQCTPATEGARTATLTLTSNDPAWPTIAYPLQCTGALVATPSYSSIPAPGSTINIGTTQVGVALVKADALQISENGTAALAVGNPSIIGTNAGDFRITSPAFPITIADGGAPQNVAIECNPTGTGARTATLTLATNDPSQPTVQYTLTCTGTAAAAPGYGSVPAPGSFINLNTIPGVPVNAQIIVSETGTATLTITSITLSDNLNFTLITPNTFQIVNGGPSENVFIRCNALGLGTFVTAVTVAHNAAGSPANYTITCNVTTTPIATPTLIITGVPTAVGPTAIPPTATPAAPGTGTISDEVKGQAIRTGPYLGATLMGGALPGQQYPILARSTDEGGEYAWYLIQAGAITGWTSGRYLRFTGDPSLLPSAGSIFDQIDGAPDVGVTAVLPALTDMRRRPSGRAAILRTLPQGAVVSVIGRTRQNGGNYWLHVRFEGQIGWIPAYVENVRGSWENVPIR